MRTVWPSALNAVRGAAMVSALRAGPAPAKRTAAKQMPLTVEILVVPMVRSLPDYLVVFVGTAAGARRGRPPVAIVGAKGVVQALAVAAPVPGLAHQCPKSSSR